MKPFKLDNSLYPFAILKINASICFHHGRIFCAYRANHMFNYNVINILSELDDRMSPLNHTNLFLADGNTAFEDVRLFSFKDRLLAIYTYLPKLNNSWEWKYQIGIGTIDLDSGKISHQQSFESHSKRYNEKNWVPYSYGDRLYIITDFDPYLRIISLTGEVGTFKIEDYLTSNSQTDKWKFGELRGGTPFIQSPSSSEYLFGFVHSSVTFDDGDKQYFHTLAKIHHKSGIFEYCKFPILLSTEEKTEILYKALWQIGTDKCAINCIFPMGIMRYDAGIIMSYGQDDCVSRLQYYTWDYIEKQFK